MENPTGHRPVRRLGQNFLKDQRTAEEIASLAGLTPEDVVMEPGAGYGSLTEYLSEKSSRVIAVEKDRQLASYLRTKFEGNSKVLVVEGDVLKVPLPAHNKIVGTPPYNISSKLVVLLTSSGFESAHLVFQKEFANRLLAKPGSDDYGRLSVTSQRRLTITSLLQIPRTAFRPMPRVDSTLLMLEPRTPSGNVDETLFTELVRGLFVQRRRLAKGALIHYLGSRFGKREARDLVNKLFLPDARVYQLSPGQLEDLSVAVEQLLEHELGGKVEPGPA